MVGLLDLPLELREPILLEVILDTTQQPPDNPVSARRSKGYDVTKIKGCGDEPWSHIHCKPLQRHAMPLLHVNRQIRAEIFDLMPRKLAQGIDDAKLDVLYVEELSRKIWATWLSAPFPTDNLDTLHAQIRDFQIGPVRTLTIEHTIPSPMQDCERWVDPECAEILLKFLADVLHSGSGKTSIYKTQRVASAYWNQTADRTVKNLVINIPFERDQQDSPETRVRCMRCGHTHGDISNSHTRRMIPSGKRAALIFAQYLHKQLLDVFETAPKFWRTIKFPRTIFESIGAIRLEVGGRPFGSLELSQILAKLPSSENWNGRNIRRTDFFQWKRAAEEMRKTAGFTPVEHSVQEHELVGSTGIIASMLSRRGESLVREVTTFSEDVAPSARQPEANERVDFMGNAIFVREDGSALPGNATFYVSATRRGHVFFWPPPDRLYPRKNGYLGEYIDEPPKDGELVLFKGEGVLIPADNMGTSVFSGECTFYGPAENGSTEQSGARSLAFPPTRDSLADFFEVFQLEW